MGDSWPIIRSCEGERDRRNGSEPAPARYEVRWSWDIIGSQELCQSHRTYVGGHRCCAGVTELVSGITEPMSGVTESMSGGHKENVVTQINSRI